MSEEQTSWQMATHHWYGIFAHGDYTEGEHSAMVFRARK